MRKARAKKSPPPQVETSATKAATCAQQSYRHSLTELGFEFSNSQTNMSSELELEPTDEEITTRHLPEKLPTVSTGRPFRRRFLSVGLDDQWFELWRGKQETWVLYTKVLPLRGVGSSVMISVESGGAGYIGSVDPKPRGGQKNSHEDTCGQASGCLVGIRVL